MVQLLCVSSDVPEHGSELFICILGLCRTNIIHNIIHNIKYHTSHTSHYADSENTSHCSRGTYFLGMDRILVSWYEETQSDQRWPPTGVQIEHQLCSRLASQSKSWIDHILYWRSECNDDSFVCPLQPCNSLTQCDTHTSNGYNIQTH